MGIVLDALKVHGYYENTMTWFTADNGPEENCRPTGICRNADIAPHRPIEAPGSAGPLRGRKRDIYEGGHRVAGIVSFPSQVLGNGTSWETVVTMDFLPTVMDLLSVSRPPEQQDWAFDGRSILPLLRDHENFRWRDTPEGPRSIGIGYHDTHLSVTKGWGYRFGQWKLVQGSASCNQTDCQKAQLFNLETDLGERHDLAEDYPDILADLKLKFKAWFESVLHSRDQESNCTKASRLEFPTAFQTQ